jgi:hypothetical protein
LFHLLQPVADRPVQLAHVVRDEVGQLLVFLEGSTGARPG